MRILTLAAHPDDEILGCGGTMARHAAEGDEVTILILGEGWTSRDQSRNVDGRSSELSALNDDAQAAADIVGARRLLFGGLPDNRFDSLDLLDVIKRVEAVKADIDPDIVYTHHGGDLNVDHQVTHQAVLTAFRPMPGSRVSAMYAFEVASSTEWQAPDWNRPFVPDHFVEIGPYVSKKRDAMACYRSELRDFPHPRSLPALEAIATACGVQAGVAAAERFMTIRTIRRLSLPSI